MKSILIEQIDLNDIKSILETHHSQMIKEIEEMVNNVTQSPVLVTRNKLIEMLDCSSSWLSKVTTSGDMPSIVIGRRVFYNLREIAKKNVSGLKNKRNDKKNV